MFFEYAKEIAPEIACEYKEKRRREEKNEFINEIDKKFKESYSRSNAVEEIIELLNENDSLKNIDEADVVRKFIFYRGGDAYNRGGDAYIPSEILDYMDPKLIQEDDALMEDLLGCWIAPNDLIYDLSRYMEDEPKYGIGLKPYEIYENFKPSYYINKYDFSEYYEKFYNKVISENINGVGTENYDYDEYHDYDDGRHGDFQSGEEAYWKIFGKMPSRMLERRGGLDNLTYEDQAYYFPIEFIIKKYVEANRIDDIEYLLKDKEYAVLRVDTISEFFDRYKYELNEDNKKKLRNIVIENIEECNESCKKDFGIYKKRLRISESDTKEFIIESYVRCEKELPEDIKEIMNIEEEEIERIKKEYELEKLQEEDRKCDEVLELVEKLDKNKEQEGQTQGDD